jgi:hypothetical protein
VKPGSPIFVGVSVLEDAMRLGRLGILDAAAVLPLILLVGGVSFGGPAPAGFVDASTLGYNATDATAALQKAIDTGKNVWVPKEPRPWIVDKINLTQSNQTIQFEKGAEVLAKKGAFVGTNDHLFTAKHVTNVKLTGYGATLAMNRTDYAQPPYKKAEWRHGLALYDVKNFQILGLTIRDTGGDGIYLGAGAKGACENVTIKDVILKGNYRNGISVISANGLIIDNTIVVETGVGTGTAPKDGVDFEPNAASQVVKNVVVKNSIFAGNAVDGLNFSTRKNPNANISNVVLDHDTFYANRARGLVFQVPEPGITVKNCLFVGHHRNGVLEKNPSENAPNVISHSAFWQNNEGPVHGLVKLGPGCITDLKVTFASTIVGSPDYLHLAPGISPKISKGADDGGYMGARPVAGH